jgi:glycosyltransferase involved in cell wall biosynthesis
MDPEWHDGANRVRARTPVLLKLGIPAMIITPSETVRRAAIERFRLPGDRIVAVPEAAPRWFQPVAATNCRPYFLFVGIWERRKNLPRLVEAWREVRRDCAVDLVLVGRRRANGPRFEAEPGLTLLGETPDAQLPALYSGAVAFLYPSLYEGFGLPVLEAMQCGACVIASSAVREAGGDAAVYADTVCDLVSAMRRAATDPTFVADRRARSLARAREFSWERSARLTYEVYQEARKRFGR